MAIDVLGPHIQFLSSLDLDESAFSVIAGSLNPGVVVPLHSHPDREAFLITEGTLDVYVNDRWQTLRAGDLQDVRDGVHHAWRNSSDTPASLILVTTVHMGHFFNEIGQPLGSVSWPPSPAAIEHFLQVADRYGFWNGTPEESAAIGLTLG